MDFNSRKTDQQKWSSRPYAMLGSGRLMITLFKNGDNTAGWRYWFNLFRLNRRNGRVSQSFAPTDLVALPKLVRLLAFELCEDGCLADDLRHELAEIATRLDDSLDEPVPRDVGTPFTELERIALREVVDYMTHFSGHVVMGNATIAWHVERLSDWLDRSGESEE